MESKFNLFIFILFFTFIFLPSLAFAQETVLPGGTGDFDCVKGCSDDSNVQACKQYCGDYQLNDFVVILVKVSEIILALSGSLALIAFIIGGFMFLASGGNSNMIEKGKLTLVGAVIGLVIVFTSYLIIGFVMKSFTGKEDLKWYDLNSMIKYIEKK